MKMSEYERHSVPQDCYPCVLQDLYARRAAVNRGIAALRTLLEEGTLTKSAGQLFMEAIALEIQVKP
jgi:hypothetical protein